VVGCGCRDPGSFAFRVKTSGSLPPFDVPGGDVTVNLLSNSSFKGAEKTKLLKYSLVVDHSSSIPVNLRSSIINFFDDFVDQLPVPVEGQVVRFSNNVEKFAFTSEKRNLKAQLEAPIFYGSTALHDALMQAATSLANEGSDAPVRVLVLFTDGYENSSTTYKDRDSFIAGFTNLVKRQHIAVLAIGVSKEQDGPLLRAITDPARGVTGRYVRLEKFEELQPALDEIGTMLNNVVIFSMRKVEPDRGKALISLMEKSKTTGQMTSAFHTFECNY
jgi:hypothetical protein